MPHRLVIANRSGHDGHADHLVAAARASGHAVADIEVLEVVHVDGDVDADGLARLGELLLTDVVHEVVEAGPDERDAVVIETGLRPGVTHIAATELVDAAARLGIEGVDRATTGRRFVVTADGDLSAAALSTDVLVNPVIERWAEGVLPPAFVDEPPRPPEVAEVALRSLDDAGLVALDADRGLSLGLDELRAVRDHFDTLGREPTDAELETIAQTWSEHCCHKTFRALISFEDGTIVDGLIPMLREATARLDRDWVVSAFDGDAGVIRLDDDVEIAVKVETHNHPSAVEPFGGANTGVGGVVRDVVASGAKPIALTDVLCFGPADLDTDAVPPGVLHPARVRDGVVAGVGDYGNKIGVPTIAGAVLHDPGYTTTPLVFCGCVGVRPAGTGVDVPPRSGDAIVVLGGAVGRDGVGGATFSSRSMGADTVETAGSSVQIGAPIVEKGVIDIVVAAREAGWYRSITDCGAGGLSSAVGELAEGVGAEVDLELVPRKYAGLAPWEVWLSEAQERVVCAVPDQHLDAIADLAAAHGVGCDVIGRFGGDDRLLVRAGTTTVVDLDLGFLHDGRPRAVLEARHPATARPTRRAIPDLDPDRALLDLLAHPSLRSVEDVVRTYDHEVLGGTVVRPTTGVHLDAPSDGTVVAPLGSTSGRAVAVGIGVNPVWGRHDARAMAEAVVDEAVRNVVAVGADPARVALLDNFSWGNPRDDVELGRLVAAVEGCVAGSLAHEAPFVCGKDSLNNVYVSPAGVSDPVPQTLVVTAVGVVEDADAVVGSDPTGPGRLLYLLGGAEPVLGGSHLDLTLGADHGGAVPTADADAPRHYRELHEAVRAGLVDACHDLSEGGVATAAAEMAVGGDVGIEVDVADHGDPVAALFGEACGRLLVAVEADCADAFHRSVPDARLVGRTTDDRRVQLAVDGHQLVDVPLDAVRAAREGRRS
ncbi:MAG: phosphoribosylformylglycinamidine synthase subunit PurL [Actinomycetota bacterium]